MLKIVPDPPARYHLEDTLIQATEFTRCALAVAHQSALASPPHSLGSTLALTAVHEIECLRTLLESALAQVQLEGQTQH